MFCHEEAHVHDDECGAPELFSGGAKLVGIAGEGGKITPDGLQETLERFPRGLVKSSQPGALSLVPGDRSRDDLQRERSLGAQLDCSPAWDRVHMDGARFANALVSAKATPADMTWRAGVDILTLGATKNGALACEAVLFFDPGQAQNFAFQRKRGGQTLSKGRFLGAQMEAYLADRLWLRLAERANDSARRLAQALSATPGCGLPGRPRPTRSSSSRPSVSRGWRAAGARLHGLEHAIAC